MQARILAYIEQGNQNGADTPSIQEIGRGRRLEIHLDGARPSDADGKESFFARDAMKPRAVVYPPRFFAL